MSQADEYVRRGKLIDAIQQANDQDLERLINFCADNDRDELIGMLQELHRNDEDAYNSGLGDAIAVVRAYLTAEA